MSGQERIFAALSGVDEELLERSEKRAKRPARSLSWGAALAACLAVVIAVQAVSRGGADLPAVVDTPPADEAAPGGTEAPVELPEGEGQYHFLQFRLDRKQDAPGFSLFVDEERYRTYERDGTYVICPRQTPEGLPECKLEITWTGTPPEEEARNEENRLGSLYENVWGGQSAAVESMWPPPWDAYILWGDNGTEWDDAQRLTWVVSDGREGSFVLSASYFMEATEGHGAMFYDMMSTFQAEREVPAWRAALEAAAETLIKEALPDGASVASIDYRVSGEGEEAQAAVTVKYRLGSEEPYETLALALSREDGAWCAGPDRP